MNNFVLMAEVVQAPQTRYTQDGQTPIAEMLVQFPGLRADDPPATLRAVGWGNLAQSVQENCKLGDCLVLEGRLRMNTLERPEGFKEKVAELTLSRFHHTGVQSLAAVNTMSAETLTPAATPQPSAPAAAPVSAPATTPPDYDDIPF